VKHPYKEYSASLELFLNSGPVPEETGPDRILETTQTPKATAVSAPPADVAKDTLGLAILREIPELAEAAVRAVSSLPAEALRFGVFAPAGLDDQCIREPVLLIPWFRRQLSAAAPIAAGNQAELLLVLAAGITARETPPAAIIRSQVALFVDLVSHRKWLKVLGRVPEAIGIVERGLERFGEELLHSADWPPRPLLPAANCRLLNASLPAEVRS
jgi:hypothetical protein